MMKDGGGYYANTFSRYIIMFFFLNSMSYHWHWTKWWYHHLYIVQNRFYDSESTQEFSYKQKKNEKEEVVNGSSFMASFIWRMKRNERVWE